MNSVRGSCKDGRDGAGDLPSSHRLAVISGSAMSAALYPYCSDFIAAPRPARRRSPIRRHRNETFAVRLGTRVPRSGVGAGFVARYYLSTGAISIRAVYGQQVSNGALVPVSIDWIVRG